MKNKEVVQLAQGLNSLRSELTGRVFTHSVALNKKKIRPYIEALEEARKPSKEMMEYLNTVEELKKESANKDANGKPIIKEGIDPVSGAKISFYDIPDGENPHSDFAKKAQVLYDENKEVIDDHTKMMLEFNEKVMDAESEFIPTMIDLEDIPDDILVEEMELIIDMINE